MLLALGGCIIPIPIVTVHYVKSEGEVRVSLAGTRQFVVAASSKLKSMTCGGNRCYRASDVYDLVQSVRKQVNDAFPPEAEGLRIALQSAIDVEVEKLGSPQPASAIQRVRWPPDPAELVYPAPRVDAAVTRMSGAIDRILHYDRLALDLKVQSTPAEAEFSIQIGQNKQTHRTLVTDSNLPAVWRGVYTATVHKRGYKDAVQPVDLLNESPTRLVCTLQPASASAESFCKPQ